MPSPSQPSLSEPDFVPDTSVVGCAFSWPNSDSELVPDNSTSTSSSEPSPARISAVASSYILPLYGFFVALFFPSMSNNVS